MPFRGWSLELVFSQFQSGTEAGVSSSVNLCDRERECLCVCLCESVCVRACVRESVC